MSDSKFTPWITKFLIDDNYFRIEDENGDHVCTVDTSPTSFETDNNHAYLIAAAPDMYKALQEMCDMWTTVCDAQGWEPEHVVQYENAVNSLAKARGECHE